MREMNFLYLPFKRNHIYNTLRFISKQNTRMIDMHNIMLVMTVWKCKTKWTH